MIIATIVNSGRTGKPSDRCAVPRFRKPSGMSAALIWRPCAHAKSMPRITYSVPSVITSDGHPRPRDHHAVHQPEERAEQHPADEHERDRHAVVGEHDAGRERGDAEDRADAEVDVARDDDDRLADREQRHDRDVEQDVAQVLRVEEARLGDADADHEDREHADQADLAGAHDRVDPRACAPRGCGAARAGAGAALRSCALIAGHLRLTGRRAHDRLLVGLRRA